MPQLGQTLQQALKDANISHTDAANYIGVSEGNLYRLFKKDTFEVAYLKKAAELLNLPISHFFEDNPSTKPSPTQIGDFNQAGSNLTQKVKVNKAQDLATELDNCHRDNEALKRELEVTRALVAAKDETITLLRASYTRPN